MLGSLPCLILISPYQYSFSSHLVCILKSLCVIIIKVVFFWTGCSGYFSSVWQYFSFNQCLICSLPTWYFSLSYFFFFILLFLLLLITECPHIVDFTPFTVFIATLFYCYFIATVIFYIYPIFFTIIGVYSFFHVCLFLFYFSFFHLFY